MYEIDLKVIEIIEKKEREYNEISNLLNSVEIMMDNKLFLYYKRKQKLLDKVVSLYREYKNLNKEFSENEELIEIEEDISIHNELIFQNKIIQEKVRETFNKIKNEIVRFQEIENQILDIEINLKSGDKLELLKFIDIIDNYSKYNKATLVVKKQRETNALLEVSGENIYSDINIFSGNVKIILDGKESILGIVVLNKKNKTFELKVEDVVVETLKADGAGGQHINKTESGIRLIHKPTGIVTICKDERSQIMNKKRAFENLEKKILEKISKDAKNDMEIQRKNIKNALFSSTPVIIINYDRNIVCCSKTKKDYDLKQILNGDLKLISSDVIIDGE